MDINNSITLAPGVEIVGELHYPGDVRKAQVMVYDSPKHGPVFPAVAEYDEATDRTTVLFAGRVEE